MSSTLVLLITATTLITFWVSWPTIATWRRRKAILKLMQSLQERKGGQQIKVADIAEELSKTGIPFEAKINPVPHSDVSGRTAYGEYLSSDAKTGSFILRIPGSIIGLSSDFTGYLSWYEVSDDLFETIRPGTVISAIIDRLETHDGQHSFVLKAPVEVIYARA